MSDLKIYEKDGAWWAESNGYTVCAGMNGVEPPLLRNYVHLAVVDSDEHDVTNKFCYGKIVIRDLPLLNHYINGKIKKWGAPCEYWKKLRDLKAEMDVTKSLKKLRNFKVEMDEKEFVKKCEATSCNNKASFVYKNGSVWCQECVDNMHDDTIAVVKPIEPELVPLTEWSDDLVGKRVVCVESKGCVKKGLSCIIKRHGMDHEGRTTFYDDGENWYTLDIFALAPEQEPVNEGEVAKLSDIANVTTTSTSKPGMYLDSDGVWKTGEEIAKRLNKESTDGTFYTWDNGVMNVGQPIRIRDIRITGTWGDESKTVTEPTLYIHPVTEITHSFTLLFPNGDRVNVPAPTGSGWKEEIVVDEWTKFDHETWGPTVVNAGMTVGICITCPELGMEETKFYILHEDARIILREYLNRIWDVKPRVLSLSKWTRIYTPTVATEKQYDWATKYPLLNGV